MASIYTYTKSFLSNFSSNLKQSQFYDEIVESEITKKLLRVNKNGDIIDIIFDAPLSMEEETILNILISNHVPINTNLVGNKIITYSLHGIQIESSGYKKLLSFMYPGKNIFNITNFEILGYLMVGNYYDVRIQDLTNNKTIAEKKLTNNYLDSNDIGDIKNLPLNKSIFEIQARINSNGNQQKIAYFDSLIIYYY